MEQLVNLLVEKVGIDRALAEKIAGVLKEHAAELPQMLSGGEGGLLGKVSGGLGGVLGGKS